MRTIETYEYRIALYSGYVTHRGAHLNNLPASLFLTVDNRDRFPFDARQPSFNQIKPFSLAAMDIGINHVLDHDWSHFCVAALGSSQ